MRTLGVFLLLEVSRLGHSDCAANCPVNGSTILQLSTRKGAQPALTGSSLPSTGSEKLKHEQVEANGMEFTCIVCASPADEAKGNVLFLHGFPLFASTFKPIQEPLCDLGYETLACNQRGYTPGASPDGIESYAYNDLRTDAWAMAEARGFETFHLVAHDHGAVLGWWIVSSPAAKDKILSYSALSVPHLVPFSESLGNETSQQAVQSQYFTQFVRPEAARFFYPTLGVATGMTKEQFQRALWWYNGAFDAGIVTMPKQLSANEIRARGEGVAAGLFATFQSIHGGAELKDAIPASNPIGEVSMPVLFACGKKDTLILCDTPYTKKTGDWAIAGYTELILPNCDHSPLGNSGLAADLAGDCNLCETFIGFAANIAQPCSNEDVKATVAAILKHIQNATTPR